MNINTVHVDGSGKGYCDIAKSYLDYITNKNFNLTIDEACYFLSCSYTYFLMNFRDICKHIYINVPARVMINKASIINHNDNLDLSIIRKKVLYCTLDFEKYLVENLKVELSYKSIEIEKFMCLNDYNILKKSFETVDIINLLNLASIQLFGTPTNSSVYNFKDLGLCLPKRLIGLKEIKDTLGYKYNTQLYRKVNSAGCKKYRLNNLVRYDIDDFNSNNVLVNFDEYKKNKNEINIMKNILKYSLDIAKQQKNDLLS